MILIDTDVLVDVALDRQPFSDAAAELLDRLQTGPKRAFVAWHTVSNFYKRSPIPAITPPEALATLF